MGGDRSWHSVHPHTSVPDCINHLRIFHHEVLKVAGYGFGQEPDVEAVRKNAVLLDLAARIDKVKNDDKRGTCIVFKDDSFTYCFDPRNGDLASFVRDNKPAKALDDADDSVRNLSKNLEQVFTETSRGLCLKFKDNKYDYCLDPIKGNFVSYNNKNNKVVPWRGLGRSPQNDEPE